MNEVLNAIFRRAGVKEYTGKVPAKEDLELLMKAGIAAPNAYNHQKWFFTAITNPELLETIDRETFRYLVKRGTSPDSPYRPLHGAKAIIAISAPKDNEFAKQDCSCANQNIALAAVSMGLATRFLDIPNMAFGGDRGAELKERCHIPDDYETVCFLSVGYPEDPDYAPAEKNYGLMNFVE